MNYSERHIIIVPASLMVQANAEAIKWDADAGGDRTFGGAGLSNDGGTTLTHHVSCTLIDSDYIPPNQNGKNAIEVLDAFYATAWYMGYRVRRAVGDTSALMSGVVEKAVFNPYRWEAIGTGDIVEIALADAGLVRYVAPEQAPSTEWAAGTTYAVGDVVTYQGVQYRCLQGHTAQPGWQPPNVPALWEVV